MHVNCWCMARARRLSCVPVGVRSLCARVASVAPVGPTLPKACVQLCLRSSLLCAQPKMVDKACADGCWVIRIACHFAQALWRQRQLVSSRHTACTRQVLVQAKAEDARV